MPEPSPLRQPSGSESMRERLKSSAVALTSVKFTDATTADVLKALGELYEMAWRDCVVCLTMTADRLEETPHGTGNLGAIAATLDALRAIDRHGGATILDRAFQGFTALPAPEQWFQVLGVGSNATADEITEAHRRLAMQHHPDRGGEDGQLARINAARDDGLRERASP